MSLSPKEENIYDEIFTLRRYMRDLAALSNLPATWAGYDQERMAESLADVLMGSLSLDLIYIKVVQNGTKSGTEVARCSQIRDSAENRQAISRSIATWLSDPFESSSVIPHPFQKGMLSVTYARFGYQGDTGIIVAGSFRPDFPVEQERLLISVGSDQAAIAIRQRRMEEERCFLLEREREAYKEAARASRLREEFLAVISHELRTPLNSVLGWTQILRRSPWQEELRGQALDCNRAWRWRTNAAYRGPTQCESHDLGKVTDRNSNCRADAASSGRNRTHSLRCRGKAVRLQSFLNSGVGFIQGDPVRLQQIFRNLLWNAIKFTPKGGTIGVHLERLNSHVEVSVNDNGQGIAPEFLSNVLNRFSQADNSGTRFHGGLGLGLTIVKHLVELHGGNTYVKSSGRQRFYIQCPLSHRNRSPGSCPQGGSRF